MLRHHELRGMVQVASAGIIAEPAPVGQHLVLRCGSEGGNIGKVRDETLVIGDDAGDLGLLQHDFRQPHRVRIASLLPRQAVSTMLFLPLDQAP